MYEKSPEVIRPHSLLGVWNIVRIKHFLVLSIAQVIWGDLGVLASKSPLAHLAFSNNDWIYQQTCEIVWANVTFSFTGTDKQWNVNYSFCFSLHSLESLRKKERQPWHWYPYVCCCWCWGLMLCVVATPLCPRCPRWNICSRWWRALSAPPSERGRVSILVSVAK